MKYIFFIMIYDMNYNIKAVTFCFPGCIDFERQEIVSTANLFPQNEEPIIHNANISLLISSSLKDKLEQKGIKIYVDHNVKTSTIAEKEMLSLRAEKIKDLIVLYLGKGVGIGMVLNNQLVRSDKNAAGQYGHILMGDPKESGKLKELEEIIREYVFEGLNMTCPAEELRAFIANPEHKQNKDMLIYVIKISLSNLIKILGVGNIIFSGKFNEILNEIEQDLAFSLAGVGENALNIRHSNLGEYAAAVGAAISAYYNYYNMQFIWN